MSHSDKQNIYSSGVNPDFALPKKQEKDVSYYLNGLTAKDRFVLSECITLLESTLMTKRNLGVSILRALPTLQQSSIRIGITGTPGVGKSTFIEAFGLYLIGKKHRPAILAIDPSSQVSRGSILGDKTRMDKLSMHPDAYIRPTASGNVLGGTAFHTKEAISMCEATGYDIIIVETVGVGQSETEVDNITDINILLLQPGAGDDIQGIKRGIVENADIFVINKADGPQTELAKKTKLAYGNALQLFHHHISDWICPIHLVSSIEEKGLDEVYQSIGKFLDILQHKGYYTEQRQRQEQMWFEKQTKKRLEEMVFGNKEVNEAFTSLQSKVAAGSIHTTEALQQMQTVIKNRLNIE
jgi:LAO/AO transport system kinase